MTNSHSILTNFCGFSPNYWSPTRYRIIILIFLKFYPPFRCSSQAYTITQKFPIFFSLLYVNSRNRLLDFFFFSYLAKKRAEKRGNVAFCRLFKRRRKKKKKVYLLAHTFYTIARYPLKKHLRTQMPPPRHSLWDATAPSSYRAP